MGPRLRHHVQGDVNNPFTMNWIGSRWDGSARGLAIEPGTRSAVDGGYLAYSSVPREIAIQASVLLRVHTKSRRP
jgi:hypothetical protein